MCVQLGWAGRVGWVLVAFLGSGFIWVGWVVSKGLSFPCAPAVPFPARAGPGPGNSGAPGWAPMPPPLLQGLLGPRSLPPGLWEVPYEGHRFGVAFVFVLFCFVGPFLHFCLDFDQKLKLIFVLIF